jgi:hypothetical protein
VSEDGIVTDFESSGIRISDADREAAMTALGEHMSAGRLDIEEYGDRSARVSTAKTRRELLVLFDDLPEPRPRLEPEPPEPPAPLAPPGPPATVRFGSTARQALIALVPFTWVVASFIGVFSGAWLVFLVPVLLSVLGGAMWRSSSSAMRRSTMTNNWMDGGMSDWGMSDWGSPADWGMYGMSGRSDSQRHIRDAQRHERDAERHIRDAQRHERDADRHARDADRKARDADRHARDAARRARNGW